MSDMCIDWTVYGKQKMTPKVIIFYSTKVKHIPLKPLHNKLTKTCLKEMIDSSLTWPQPHPNNVNHLLWSNRFYPVPKWWVCIFYLKKNQLILYLVHIAYRHNDRWVHWSHNTCLENRLQIPNQSLDNNLTTFSATLGNDIQWTRSHS